MNLSKKLGAMKKIQGQVVLEFAFCMVIVMLMIYGIVMILRWTGTDLAERRRAHDSRLFSGIARESSDPSSGPLWQIDPYFYNPIKMNAIWKGRTGF